MITGIWNHPAVIAENRFKYKSLSNWSYNIAVGCNHGCTFCYVPSASTNKMSPALAEYGVMDPDGQWGDYVILRQWNEREFRNSLKRAEKTPIENLAKDGNRAVMLCTTTDAYQVMATATQQEYLRTLVRGALKMILEESTLNVRILTRSPLAKLDFDLFKEFGDRLLFGMSLPTLNNKLARVYEPKAPAPSQRLSTLQQARDAGLNIYVAVAPTYPDSDYNDMRATFQAVSELNPVTVFHEPINIRAENVARIAEQGRAVGVDVNTSVFQTPAAWRLYALNQLNQATHHASLTGLKSRLHLWPDASLGSRAALDQVSEWNPHECYAPYKAWLDKCWNRVSEWPGKVQNA